MTTTTRKRRRWYKLGTDIAVEKELVASALADDPHWIPPSWLDDESPDDSGNHGLPGLLTVPGEGGEWNSCNVAGWWSRRQSKLQLR
jgi:hypothetical protein